MSVLGLTLVTVVIYLLHGVSLQLLWRWFVSPTFGLPAISLVQAIGIGIIVDLLTKQHIPRDKDAQKELIAFQILSPVFAVAIGWIVHLFR